MSARTDARPRRHVETSTMPTYAVAWLDTLGRVHAGKLELGAETLTLEGGSARATLRYDDLADVHVGRGADERIMGRPALVLRGNTGETVYVSSLNGAGVLAEIAERLAAV
jgi:hypothetical protein